MSLPHSERTQDILDRAQRAIDRSIEIINEHAAYLQKTRRKAIEDGLRLSRIHAARISNGDPQRRTAIGNDLNKSLLDLRAGTNGAPWK